MKTARAGVKGQVRIIGGRWRSRRLKVPAAEGLRPTPDRIRETLFNWLQPVIGGACCLDLFAGSGALGLEAASRGAGRVVLIEKDARVAAHLRDLAQQLGADSVQVFNRDGPGFLQASEEGFDIVFLDPPYGSGLLPMCLTCLARPGLLRPGARVYVEHAAKDAHPELPAGWSMMRETHAGDVVAMLAVSGDA